MDLGSLVTVLESTGLPVAYHHFKKPPSPPYIVYLSTDSDNFSADNKVYAKINNCQVELYAKLKDQVSEQKIEDALDLADIFYEKSEIYIDSEELYQVIYEIQI